MYLYLIDYSIGMMRFILLTDEEAATINNSNNPEYEMYDLEDKYDFHVNQCSWMFSDQLNFSIESPTEDCGHYL